MSYYKDLREYIDALEKNNKLVRIRREINKDTQLMPLVRWQFRGLPEKERKAFLFENVVDAKGKKYKMPVLVAAHAASTDVYAIGMKCEPDKIVEKWAQAQLHPVEPRMVKTGLVHEEVHIGDRLLEAGGLSEIPVPISTPGFDNAPYLSAPCWVTKDPETGIRNVGVYRAMIKSNTRTGIQVTFPQHLRVHWEKCRQQKKPLQAAIVIGASPAVGYAACTRFPYGTDELGVSGGIAGEPLELVKCKTVDLEVPATAEIVIEGISPTDSLEREAPFGEFSGYMGTEMIQPYFNVTCITHRRDAIYNAFISQFPPSESSKLRHLGKGAALYKFLRYDCGLPVLDVAQHESCGCVPYCVIKMKKIDAAQPWQALYAVLTKDPKRKFVIVVDEDIDPREADSVNWAMSFRVQPHKDVRIIEGVTPPFLDPSINRKIPEPTPGLSGGSALLIDATIKFPYPPVSLPRKEFMEEAKQIWEKEGLPQLNPKTPWHGYTLGGWSEENEEEAELALKGEHYQTGEKLAKKERIYLDKEGK
ncbi:MAG: UbiD family decarboxylase [Chloroflexi bacterium]|nr:UbiD family decarboxylase [Chloroflexota bacterium]